MADSKTSLSGFTLVELSIVVALAGFALATAASFALPIIEASKRLQTDEKIKVISRAISEYAQVSSSVPCPAVPNRSTTNPPFGYAMGTGATGSNMPTDCGLGAATQPARGIVPFRVLNIPEDMVRDGWGNYFVYAVSQNFTRHFLAGTPPMPTTTLYHAQCRTRAWYKKVGPRLMPINLDLGYKYPEKAHFCCRYDTIFNPNTDIQIQNFAGNVVSPIRSADDSAGPPAAARQRIVMGAQTDPAAAPVPQPYQNLDPNLSFVPKGASPVTVVYALVSLGRNGRGRYDISNGTLMDQPPVGSFEATNLDTASRVFVAGPPNDDPANQFDDIVYWETQDMILAQEGESCATP